VGGVHDGLAGFGVEYQVIGLHAHGWHGLSVGRRARRVNPRSTVAVNGWPAAQRINGACGVLVWSV
jgi:hypothetical protein